MYLPQARPLCPQLGQQAIPDLDMLLMETLKTQVTVLRMISGILIDEALNSLPQTGEPLPQTGVQIHLEEEEEVGEMEGDITQMRSTTALPIALMMTTLVGLVKG